MAKVETKLLKQVIQSYKNLVYGFPRLQDGLEYIRAEISKEDEKMVLTACDGRRISVDAIFCETDTSFICYFEPNQIIFPNKLYSGRETEFFIEENELIVTNGIYTVKIRQPNLAKNNIWQKVDDYLEDVKKRTPIAKIGVNLTLLNEALKSMANTNQELKKNVVMSLAGENKPILIRALHNEDSLRFILPINIGAIETEW